MYNCNIIAMEIMLLNIFSKGIQGDDVNEVYMGNVCQAMEGQAPCRQATLGAGKYQNGEQASYTL